MTDPEIAPKRKGRPPKSTGAKAVDTTEGPPKKQRDSKKKEVKADKPKTDRKTKPKKADQPKKKNKPQRRLKRRAEMVMRRQQLRLPFVHVTPEKVQLTMQLIRRL